MTEEVKFHDRDILSGKINPDTILSRYVFIYAGGVKRIYPENPIKAANLMSKYGWRVVGVSDWGVLMERE